MATRYEKLPVRYAATVHVTVIGEWRYPWSSFRPCDPGPAISRRKEPPIAADYYSVDTENGDHMNDPSEDGLFMLLSELNRASNTFITITPADNDPAWYASVTLLANGTYDVERNDRRTASAHRDTRTSPHDIARDLIIWLAGRGYHGRPARRSNSEF